MAVCGWTLLNEAWDALGDWADNDSGDSESSISPAGELRLDATGMSGAARARRTQDIGTIGTGDFTVYLRIKIDDNHPGSSPGDAGLKLEIQAGTNYLVAVFANQADGTNDGIWVYDGAAYVHVATNTWDTGYHTVTFNIHNSQTDVDILIDDVSKATDADMTLATGTDGIVQLSGYGTDGDDGDYHVDYVKINAGLCDPTEAAGPAGVKTINELAIASVKTIQQTAIGSVKTIQGSAA